MIDNERFIDLSKILNLADLEKFAKYKPLADENDLSLKNAIIFVEKTLVEKKELKIEVNENETNILNSNIENKNIENTDSKDIK